jgi:hypothetical protein
MVWCIVIPSSAIPDQDVPPDVRCAGRRQPDHEGDRGGQVERSARKGGRAVQQSCGDPEPYEEGHGITSG